MKQDLELSLLQEEILTVLIEESAEVIQEACKVKRFGLSADNAERLLKEVSQLERMIELFHSHITNAMGHEASVRSYDYFVEKAEKMKVFTTYIKDVL